MIIKRPVYLVVVEGDVKLHASQVPTTIIASYEREIDRTYIVVAGNENDFSEFVKKKYERIHTDIAKNRKLLKREQVFVTHHPEGIEFKTV